MVKEVSHLKHSSLKLYSFTEITIVLILNQTESNQIISITIILFCAMKNHKQAKAKQSQPTYRFFFFLLPTENEKKKQKNLFKKSSIFL